MNFVSCRDTRDGHFDINMDNVLFIQNTWHLSEGNMEHTAHVTFVGGHEAHFRGLDFPDHDTFVPALPGYFMLRFYKADVEYGGEFHFVKVPVVAWGVRLVEDSVFTARAVILGDDEGNNRSDEILTPDGMVITFEEEFNTIEEWFDYKKKNWKE